MKNLPLHTVIIALLATLPMISMAEDAKPLEDAASVPGEVLQAGQKPKIIRYVDDNLVIMMRSGSSRKHKIVRKVSSGRYLEVLGTEGKYTQVRTRKGSVGWVLSRYLAEEPAAKHKLITANKQLSKLDADNKQLKKELSTISKQHSKLTKQNNKMSDQLQNFRSVAAKPIQLQEENQGLLEEKITIENDNDILRQEMQVLRDQSQQHWFLAGAGVLLAGTILGLLAPKMRRRRKSDWGSL